MKITKIRLIYLIVVVVLLGGYFAGTATGFRMLSTGSTITAAVIGPRLVQHK